MQLPLAERLVYSPHVYGPGTNSKMYYFNRSAFPQVRVARAAQYGKLSDEAAAIQALTRSSSPPCDVFTPQFPDNMPAIWRAHFLAPARAAGATLVVGEWGGVYTGADELWQDRFKSFLLEERLSSFYWALNPNSGDTGGLLLQARDGQGSQRQVYAACELPSSEQRERACKYAPQGTVAAVAKPSPCSCLLLACAHRALRVRSRRAHGW